MTPTGMRSLIELKKKVERKHFDFMFSELDFRTLLCQNEKNNGVVYVLFAFYTTQKGWLRLDTKKIMLEYNTDCAGHSTANKMSPGHQTAKINRISPFHAVRK